MSNAFRASYDSLPPSIIVPPECVNRPAEVIILFDTDRQLSCCSLGDFFGSIPDFPERDEQGKHEDRDRL